MQPTPIVDFDSSRSRFVIRVPFAETDRVRRLASRRFHPASKSWLAPLVRTNVRELQTWPQTLMTPAAREVINNYEAQLETARAIGPLPPKFQSKTRPYAHQEEAFRRSWATRHMALFAGIGTGKTKVAIDLMTCRRVAGLVDSVVVLCPKSVRNSWIREIGVHGQEGATARLLVQTARKAHDEFVAADGFRWYVVAIESLSAGRAADMAREFLLSCKNPAIVCDESHLIKNPQAARTKCAQQLASICGFRLIMTGSPVANHILDLYAQFEFLDPEIIGIRNWYDFRARYAVMGGYENRQIIGYRNVPELLRTIAPFSIEIRKEDVLDLPPVVFQRRDVELSAKARVVYQVLRKTFQYEGTTVQSTITLMLRLQQICGGFLAYKTPEDTWETRPVDDDFPKIRELVQLVQEVEDRSFIIWCRYINEIERVAQELSALGLVGKLHGSVSEADRDATVQAYRTGKIRFLVANAAVGGTGINGLQEQPSVMVFYSSSFSSVEREQAIGRVNRSGQVAPLVVVDLVMTDTVDEAVLESLEQKLDVAEYVKARLGSRAPIEGVVE